MELEIPAEVIERTVMDRLLLAPRITPDGAVTTDVRGKDELDGDSWLEVAVVPINELVTRAIAPESLRLEGVETSDLTALQELLEQSLSKVRAAIATATQKT